MATTAPQAFCRLGSAFELLKTPPPTGESGRYYREIVSEGIGFACDRGHKFTFVPTGAVTHTINNFPNVQLGGVAVNDATGAALDMNKLQLVQVRLAARNVLEPVAGQCIVTLTDVFRSGTVIHTLKPGDPFLLGRQESITVGGGTAIALDISSPDNLLVECLIIGRSSSYAS